MMRDRVFNSCMEAVLKVIEQGGASIAENSTCLYRGSEGKRCVVGWMIPDEHYDASMEGKSAGQPVIRNVLGLEGESEIRFAGTLQRAHDKAGIEVLRGHGLDFVEEFKANIKHNVLGLDFLSPDQVKRITVLLGD